MKRVRVRRNEQPGLFSEDDLTPDLAARRVIVAAYAYYVLDQPIMSDAAYDRLSKYVANNWDELDRDRQWALDTPEDTRAGGSHIFFSQIAVGACYRELINRGKRPRFPFPTKWKQTKKGRRYVTARR